MKSQYAKEKEINMLNNYEYTNTNTNSENVSDSENNSSFTPKVHSRTKISSRTGSVDVLVNQLQTANVHGKIFNQDKINYAIQMIDTDLLDPLDSQRDTSAEWATKRLIDQGGLNAVYMGVLSVVKIPDSPRYKVFDGCGRLLMAQLQGLKEVPCLVHTINEQEASCAFAYMQSNGRRNLTKEIIFVNRVAAGEQVALDEQAWLEDNGLYIVAADNLTVPAAGQGQVVKYRVVEMVCKKYTDSAVSTVLGWIRAGWPTAKYIPQDLFMGMLHVTKKVPETIKNGLQTAIKDFFENINIRDIKDVKQWKRDGGAVHNQEDASVATGFWKAFTKSKQWKTSFANVFTLNKVAPKK